MTKAIFGTKDDDGLSGGNTADVVVGYAGDDALSGGNGNDILVGDGFSETQVTLISLDRHGVEGDDVSENAHFSADGTQIVFQSEADNLIAGGDLLGVSDVFAKNLVTGELVLVSSDSSGHQSNGESFDASFAGLGNQVVFTTNADNLLDNDVSGGDDIVIKDLTTGMLTLVSSAKNGTHGDGDSEHAAFSPDSGKVVFDSDSDNLILSDLNGVRDIFMKTLSSGTVRLISATADGDQANGASHNAVFSQNGLMVAFESDATNLSAADTNGVTDVYAKSLIDNDVILLSSSKTGVAGNGASGNVSFSADGTHAIFESAASNLVGHDTNGHEDVFIKNIATGSITLVSANADGVAGNGNSYGGVFSPDGTRVAFYSDATNFAFGDTNLRTDVFVKDLVSGDIVRVSVGYLGIQGDGNSSHISWSPDGAQLVFQSDAHDLTNDSESTALTNIFTATLDTPAGGDDVLDGGNGNDTFLPGAGTDTITGGAGDDIVYFRSNLDSSDAFDGGDGNDTIYLDGNYSASVTLGAGVQNIDTLILTGVQLYNLVSVDANVAAGATLTVDSRGVDSEHFAHFDGSAETNGSFYFIAGASGTIFKGGAGNDFFDLTRAVAGSVVAIGNGGSNTYLFNGNFDASDTITGGGGDLLSLNGDYGSGIFFANTTVTGVSNIVMAAGHNYAFNVGSASLGTAQMTVSAMQFGAANTLSFFAGNQTQTAFVLTGGAGNDYLNGGALADTFDTSAGGSDTVNGAGGNDIINVGSALRSGDAINGGGGVDKVVALALAGSGGAQLSITSAMLTNVETLQLSGGGIFNFATQDGVLATGQTLTIDATLATGNVTFSGIGELGGAFAVIDSRQADTLTGGGGNDTFHLLQFQSGNNSVQGGGGNDVITVDDHSGSVTDTLGGGTGNDTINLTVAQTGDTFLLGGSDGNDVVNIRAFGLSGFLSKFQFDGGIGTDTLNLTVVDGFDAGPYVETFKPGSLTGVENLTIANILGSGITTKVPVHVQILNGALASGQILTVDANGASDFDGSAETHGTFHVLNGISVEGGSGNDILSGLVLNGGGGDDVLTADIVTGSATGGAGNDTLFGADVFGNAGNDILHCDGRGQATGGSGNDTFVITQIVDPGAVIELREINDFDASADKFDLNVTINATNAKITIANLDLPFFDSNFDADLAAGTKTKLSAHHAALVAGHDGTMFIVVDVNGVAGWQAGQDILIDITGATHLSSFSHANFI